MISFSGITFKLDTVHFTIIITYLAYIDFFTVFISFNPYLFTCRSVFFMLALKPALSSETNTLTHEGRQTQPAGLLLFRLKVFDLKMAPKLQDLNFFMPDFYNGVALKDCID
jgi:hypothetical protein